MDLAWPRGEPTAMTDEAAARLTMAATPPRPAGPLAGWRQGLSYGALGLPLAFATLPLYVTLPQWWAAEVGVSLAALGSVLLATRALDALADPMIGSWADRLFARSPRRAWALAAAGALLLALGFAALWRPQPGVAPLAWLAGALVLTYLGYSLVSVVHQAWGARWGGRAEERAGVVAWREGLALAGVLLAAVLPAWLGFGPTSALLALLLAVGLGLLWGTRGAPGPLALAPLASRPWSHAPFRALLGVYALNGIASAVPATLLPFFVRDVLQAPSWEPVFLGGYFACAALGLPLWVLAVRRFGLSRCWLASMLLTVAVFAAAPLLQAGDAVAFLAVCLASGLCLGADLAIPAALLTGVLHTAGGAGQGEGRWFGWWACVTKLNLALAAGLALPLLQALGYAAGSRDAAALQALSWTYAGLPCLLKLLAAAALLAAARRHAAIGRQA